MIQTRSKTLASIFLYERVRKLDHRYYLHIVNSGMYIGQTRKSHFPMRYEVMGMPVKRSIRTVERSRSDAVTVYKEHSRSLFIAAMKPKLLKVKVKPYGI